MPLTSSPADDADASFVLDVDRDGLGGPVLAQLLRLGNGALFIPAVDPEDAFAGVGASGGCLCGTAHPRMTDTFAGSSVNLPCALGLSWRHDGDTDWFRPGPGELTDARRRLRMQEGVALREAEVEDAQGRRTLWRETRLVSLVHADVVLLRWTLTPLNWSGPILVRSQIDLHAVRRDGRLDDQVGVHNLMPADGLSASVAGVDGRLVRVDVQLHTSGAPCRQAGRGHDNQSSYQQRRVEAPLGETIAIDVRLSITEPDDTPPPVDAPLLPGFEQEIDRQRAAWRGLWGRVAFAAPSDAVLEQQMRFAAFHLLQTLSPLSVGRDGGLPVWAVPDGEPHRHGEEALVSTFYSVRLPAIARELLGHAHRRLDAARAAAAARGLTGATFPGRADALLPWGLWQHHLATQDRALLGGASGDLLVELARAWGARVARGDTVPLMGAWTLRCAAGLAEHLDNDAWAALRERTELAVDDPLGWSELSRRARIAVTDDGVPSEPDALLLVHLLGPVEFGGLLAHLGHVGTDASARTVAFHALRPTDTASASDPLPAFAHVVHAGALASVDTAASWRHFRAALAHPWHGAHRRAGSHAGALDLRALAGCWDVLRRHYLGIVPGRDGVHLTPHLPDELDDVSLRVSLSGHGLVVRLAGPDLTLRTEPGAGPLQVHFRGESRSVSAEAPWTVRCR